MSRPPLKTSNAVERAVADVKAAKSVQELRQAQAVLMPLLGFSLEQTAQVIGRNRGWVSRNRTQYLRWNLTVAEADARGGRRNQLIENEEELRFVKHALLNQTRDKSVRELLSESILKATGRAPSQSTLTAMLGRAAEKYIPGASIVALQRASGLLRAVWKAQAELDSYLNHFRK